MRLHLEAPWHDLVGVAYHAVQKSVLLREKNQTSNERKAYKIPGV